MLGFVQSWFAPAANPIGVDFGSDALRMAQVEPIGTAAAAGPGEFRLVAAARADVPSHVRNDPAARMAFFAEAVRDLWSQGNFRGRRAVLGLPAAAMTIQHLRITRMEDEALRQALPWEARGKLPYDPTHAVLRHVVAGEIHQDGEQKSEVILLAAQREFVNQLLLAASRAKLDVVGMDVEPKALVDCFGHVYRRKADAESTSLFVDIGCTAARAVVARGPQILFARVIPVGGDHFTRAVAAALKISFEDAKLMRIKLAQQAPAAAPAAQQAAPPAPGSAAVESMPGLPPAPGALNDGQRDGAPAAARPAPAPPAAAPAGSSDADRVAHACRDAVARLVDELSLCRRYHEATFPNLPVDRLVFVGGEARHRSLCQDVARGLELAAQLGDPMVRMARVSEIGPESGIDRRLPQPDWSIALGLSMGPVTGAGSNAAPSTAAAKA